jgi:hypothetical protein
MTATFEQVLISAAMVSSKCYLKCAYHPHTTNKDCNPNWWNKESRYCPENAPWYTCQIECITTQKAGNHLKALPGANHLKEHGANMTIVAQDSWYNYWKNAGNFMSPAKIAEGGVLTLDGNLTSGHGMFTLPVSISQFNRLTEFDGKNDFGGHKTQNQQFACSSGDWTSNLTPAFMDRLGLGVDSKDVKSGMAIELIEKICKFDLTITSPFSIYGKFCNSVADKTSHQTS